jgi:probable phosphoglycerate mutase
MARFLLIRHGLTDAVGRTLCGTAAGVHLNAEGRAQATRLAGRLGGVKLEAVVSSPLERAIETAAAIADGRGLTVESRAAFAEFEVGEWTGSAFSDLERSPTWQRFNRVRSVARAPGGESMLDVQQRAIAALLQLQRERSGGTIAVVSHGDVIRAVLQYVLGMPIDFLHRIEIVPASVSVLDLGDDEPRVLQVNGCTAGDRA